MVTIPQPVESVLGLGPGEIVEQAEKTLGRSMLLRTPRCQNCGPKVQDAPKGETCPASGDSKSLGSEQSIDSYLEYGGGDYLQRLRTRVITRLRIVTIVWRMGRMRVRSSRATMAP